MSHIPRLIGKAERVAFPSVSSTHRASRGERDQVAPNADERECFDRQHVGFQPARRNFLCATGASIASAVAAGGDTASANDGVRVIANDAVGSKRAYFQRFPTLFAPLYGEAKKETTLRQLGENIWAVEQNLELGPLQTPIRCVVIRLKDGSLWVHAPLAPTEEFFELVESCASAGRSIAHVVVPTYALEHKVFTKDALNRWPNAKLWTAPGQFSFPFSASDEYVWGKSVSGVLFDCDEAASASEIPWVDEIQFETLTAGTFTVGFSPVTFYETAFYHRSSRTLIVTDAVAQVQTRAPALSDPQRLLLISKKSTSDPLPEDSPAARQIGWEKTALLVSYFFPEHEELDPAKAGVVTWTEGWHDNFSALAGRLLVPPVVRTLIYAQNPQRVRQWVERVVQRWDFAQVVPAHWEAPVAATPRDVLRAFAFLEDETIDPFPRNDLRRGLQPIADLFVRKGKAA